MLKSAEKLSELATANTELTTKLETATAKVTELEGKVTAAETKVSELTTAAEAHAGAIAEKDATISELSTLNTQLSTEKARLEAEKTTVDQAADVKARELAARAGGNLPAKHPGAGNKTTEGAAAGGAPRERLAAFFNSQLKPAIAAVPAV